MARRVLGTPVSFGLDDAPDESDITEYAYQSLADERVGHDVGLAGVEATGQCQTWCLRLSAFHLGVQNKDSRLAYPVHGARSGARDVVSAEDFPQSPAFSGRRCCAKAVIVRYGRVSSVSAPFLKCTLLARAS